MGFPCDSFCQLRVIMLLLVCPISRSGVQVDSQAAELIGLHVTVWGVSDKRKIWVRLYCARMIQDKPRRAGACSSCQAATVAHSSLESTRVACLHNVGGTDSQMSHGSIQCQTPGCKSLSADLDLVAILQQWSANLHLQPQSLATHLLLRIPPIRVHRTHPHGIFRCGCSDR